MQDSHLQINNGEPFPSIYHYKRAKIIANYLELACIDFSNVYEKSKKSDSVIMTYYSIVSCWKLLWCLSVSEIIGESLRNKIEIYTTKEIEETEKYKIKKLDIPLMSEGNVPRYAMAYSPVFRIVLSLLRWLRWEARTNPRKQISDDINSQYFGDYAESRIYHKEYKGEKRFYHLDWPLLLNKADISRNDFENIESIFRIIFQLLRRGCRIEAEKFIYENAKCHWIMSLIDGADPYLYCTDPNNDIYVDLADFISILPKIDDIGSSNYKFELYGSEVLEGLNNAETGHLIRESLEFVDGIEKCLVFPSTNGRSENIIAEGNIWRQDLFKILRYILNEPEDAYEPTYNIKPTSQIGPWEKAVYGYLSGDFNSLVNISKDKMDKLFALFQTEKLNICNKWIDYMETKTQGRHGNLFIGKTYPLDIYEKAFREEIYKEVITGERKSQDSQEIANFEDLENRQLDLKSNKVNFNEFIDDGYSYSDFSNEDEYNILQSILTHSENQENNIIHTSYNEGPNIQGYLEDISNSEKQIIDALVDSLISIEYHGISESEELFYKLFISITCTALNPHEYENQIFNILEDMIKFVSSTTDIDSIPAIRAFLAHLIVAHIEVIENSSKLQNEEFYFVSFIKDKSNDYSTNISVSPLIYYPFVSISPHFADILISQYIDYIISSKIEALGIALLLLEYTSKECRIVYITKVLNMQKIGVNTSFLQRIIHSLVNKFPVDIIIASLNMSDNIYQEINDLDHYNLNELENFITSIEFIILLYGTLYQFLIVRQDYIPEFGNIYEIILSLLQEYEFSEYYSSQDKLINPALYSLSTVMEVMLGVFFLSKINPLCLILESLEIKKDKLGFNISDNFLFLKHSTSCLNDFLIPILVEPIMIRLTTIIQTNIDQIKPEYVKFHLSNSLMQKSLSSVKWEEFLVNLVTLNTKIYIDDICIDISPLRLLWSHITYLEAVERLYKYQKSLDDLHIFVIRYDQQNIENSLRDDINGNQNINSLQTPYIYKSGNNVDLSPYTSNFRRNSITKILEKSDKKLESILSNFLENKDLFIFFIKNWFSCLSQHYHMNMLVISEYFPFETNLGNYKYFTILQSEYYRYKSLLFKCRSLILQTFLDHCILVITYHHETEVLMKSLKLNCNNEDIYNISNLLLKDIIQCCISSNWIIYQLSQLK
ncbi:uncharacterized protein CMU_032600 [Cryptosporidium muris RN66]|uniref:Uncharacterized protein n=1 Tax=Cryptosporidium muris (strain RN66) TaxID=441375 RepID=B6AF84_CRYMR|nr:uncharacterized protein CMU_032600 [Cryptosporidium muris RN66]EEA06875.1 hypothetical protein, conserved [Cryptosporidium muris RN66]|eukprot:XP_002141224.1 hypothetical protein [Cryptosporidium muris RN66]